MVWPKFKLSTCGLKFYDASVLLDSFWSCIFMFFVFLEERDIKVEQNYIFSHVLNRSGLQNSNLANLRWVKCLLGSKTLETNVLELQIVYVGELWSKHLV